jgi:hypothetical protein
MNYIIDSCVWIDYFRNKINFKEISQLLIDNLALTNKIILSEHDYLVCQRQRP